MGIELEAEFTLKSYAIDEQELKDILYETFFVCEEIQEIRLNCLEKSEEDISISLWSCSLNSIITPSTKSKFLLQRILDNDYIIYADVDSWVERKISRSKSKKSSVGFHKIVSSFLHSWEHIFYQKDSKQLESLVDHGSWLDNVLAYHKLVEDISLDDIYKQISSHSQKQDDLQKAFEGDNMIRKFSFLTFPNLEGLSKVEQKELEYQTKHIFYILVLKLDQDNSIRNRFYVNREFNSLVEIIHTIFTTTKLSFTQESQLNKIDAAAIQKQYQRLNTLGMSFDEVEDKALALDDKFSNILSRIHKNLPELEADIFTEAKKNIKREMKDLNYKIKVIQQRKKQSREFDYTPTQQRIKSWNEIEHKGRKTIFVEGMFQDGLLHYNQHYAPQHIYSAKYPIYQLEIGFDQITEYLNLHQREKLLEVLDNISFDSENLFTFVDDEQKFSDQVIQPILEQLVGFNQTEKEIVSTWLERNKFNFSLHHNIKHIDNKQLHFSGNIVAEEEDLLIERLLGKGAELQNNTGIILPTYNSWGNLQPGGAYCLETDELCVKYVPHYFPNQQTFSRKKKFLKIHTKELTFDYLIKKAEREAQKIEELCVVEFIQGEERKYIIAKRTKKLEKNASFVGKLEDFIQENPHVDLVEKFSWDKVPYYVPNYNQEGHGLPVSFYYKGKFYSKSSLTLEILKAQKYGSLEKFQSIEFEQEITPDLNGRYPKNIREILKYYDEPPFFMQSKLFKEDPDVFQEVIELVEGEEEIFWQDAPKSEMGRLELIAKDADKALETLQELGSVKNVPMVPQGAILELEKSVQHKIASDSIQDPLSIPEDIAIVHALSHGEEAPEELLKSISDLGGLLSIQLRRHHNLPVSGLSPAGDIISGLDMGVPTSLVSDAVPYESEIFFLIKPSMLSKQGVWFTNQDFGGGSNRELKYNQYAQKLGAVNYQDVVPKEGKQRHLEDFSAKKLCQSNEVYFKNGINNSDIYLIFVTEKIMEKIKQKYPELLNIYNFKTFEDMSDYTFRLEDIHYEGKYRLS